MKILVTGGAGYIGSVTTEYLLDQGHTVVVVDNLSNGHSDAMDSRVQRLYNIDLLDKAQLTPIIHFERPEGVIHFAGSIEVGESMKNPGKYFENNIMGGLNLLEAIVTMPTVDGKQKRPKIIFSSTAATYGRPKQSAAFSLSAQFKENDAASPVSPYGASKYMFEQILEWYWKVYGLPYIVLRYFNAAGATKHHGEDHIPETHLIPRILDVALKQRDIRKTSIDCSTSDSRHGASNIVTGITVFGDDYPTPDGTCVRDYIHVLDLADAHLKALLAEATQACIMNLGTGRGYSVFEIIQTARKITGVEIPVIVTERRSGDPAVLIADASLAKQILGWSPQHSDINSIIQSAWNWHQKKNKNM